MPDDPVPAAALRRRLLRLKSVLEDLDRHARRMARWTARRALRPERHRYRSPMRPGWPPGWRRRNRYDIDEVLKECHRLALWAAREGPS